MFWFNRKRFGSMKLTMVGLMVMVLFLSACGNNNSGNASNAGSESTAAPTAEATEALQRLRR